MKIARALLTATALMTGTAFGAAQQQYDSPGSPTPAPHQNAAPPAPAGHSASGSGTSESSTGTTTGTGGGNLNAGTSTITDPAMAPDSTLRQTNPKTQPSNTGGVDD
ncbi:hypothetical protein [Rhodoplanes sp. Z2-YC6860]|uniref:hypothetical protein n=1 Tax=Rhodoplanes sp. Z2-YC6860 TaxID=674703 RepID=UPI00082F9232|nr:hypothetical protein [Rhodoplanes sp. Z2-YC6860]